MSHFWDAFAKKPPVQESPDPFWKTFEKKAHHEVYVSRIYKEAGDRGGFYYSWSPGGKIEGRVGSGISDHDKKAMLASPKDYIGRMAKVASSHLRKRSLIKPSFKEWITKR